MDHTQYLHLSKPDIAVDHANINDLNGNMDIIDTALHEAVQSEGQVISETLDGSTDTYTGYALFAQGGGTLETSKHTSSVMLFHTEDSDRIELSGYIDMSNDTIDMTNTHIDGDVTFRSGIVADGGIRAGEIAIGSDELRADNATGYFGSIISGDIDCSSSRITGYSGYFDYEVHGETGYFDNLYVNGEPVTPGGGFDGYFPDPVYFQDTIHVDNTNHSGSIKFNRTDSSQTLIDFTGYHDTGYITGVDELATLHFTGSSDNHNYIGYLDSNNIDVTGDITKTVSGTTHTYRTIEANPSGTATDTLTSVNIGGTVYDIDGGNTNYQELTQAEYDALSEAEKTNGTLYFITDGEGGGGSAELDILGEASGAVASFADGASAGLAKCIVEIVPKQDLHGYDKPWAGGAGKNKAELTVTAIKANNSNLVWNGNEATHNGVTYTILTDDDNNVVGIKAHGLASALSMIYIVKDVNYNDNITMSGCPTGGTLQSYEIQSSIGSDTYRDYGSGISFSWNQSASMILIIRSGFNADNLIFKPMIRTSGDSTFEPYSNICPISGHSSVTVTVSDGETSTTKTTQLGQTVYGGTLDVVTGVLTVTYAYLNYNGSESWQANSNRYTIGVSGSYREGYTRIPVTSNEGAFTTGSSVGTIFLSNTQLYYYPPTSVTSLAEFKAWLGSNNLQVVYPLATPQTVQLTPQEVNSLLGQNNISADTGDIDIVYVRASAPIQPNPTGTPTATLKKLGIEGTVFEIPSGGGGSSGGINYSTTEQVIGTWIDGKPLYQRTFDLTAVQLTDNAWNNSILGTIGIKIKHFDGLFSLAQTEPCMKYEYYRSATSYFTATLADDASDINVRPNMNAGTLYAGIVTVQYTKITD